MVKGGNVGGPGVVWSCRWRARVLIIGHAALVGHHCGKPDDDSLAADKPSLVVEVLSPTTLAMDVAIKLQEYQSLDSLDQVLLVDTEIPKVHFQQGPGASSQCCNH